MIGRDAQDGESVLREWSDGKRNVNRDELEDVCHRTLVAEPAVTAVAIYRLPDLHYCAGMKRPPVYAAGERIRFRWKDRQVTGAVHVPIGELGRTLIVGWDSGDACAIGAWDVIERLETA